MTNCPKLHYPRNGNKTTMQQCRIEGGPQTQAKHYNVKGNKVHIRRYDY